MDHQRDITDPNIAKALAHPLRVRLLGILEERTASPSELAEATGAELTLVSYHVRRLKATGLIRLVSTTPRRGAIEHHYAAVPRTTITSDAWAQVPSVAKSAMVGATLAKLGERINEAASKGGFERAEAHLSRTPVVLDAQGFSEVADRLDALMADLEDISAASRERLADSGEAIAATAVLMLFEGGEVPAEHRGARSGERAAARS
ncbi:ArsR/SmtB family transcription factor [Baekduia soli]|uniref:ArsR/SmtB family transcription factor n=1 Tax=Baekduia soli TaxID=496014 RepID=UPI001652B63A|nr:winged helix-turn-helix domain-containing protein [Baekduia soli]